MTHTRISKWMLQSDVFCGRVGTGGFTTMQFNGVEVHDEACVLEPDFLDKAILGSYKGCLVYSYEALVEAYQSSEDGWDYDEAVEFVNFNTLRGVAYMGPRAPYIVSEMFEEDILEDETIIELNGTRLMVLEGPLELHAS